MEIPVISLMTLGFAIAIPPTALVTETAGVNTPSAIVKLKVMNTSNDMFKRR